MVSKQRAVITHKHLSYSNYLFKYISEFINFDLNWLSDFVDSQQPGIPSDVLIAIIQLTEFLNAEDIKEDGDDG